MWQPGDEIFATANLFRTGANAEFVALDGRSAARKPRSADHVTAAVLPLVNQTAWEALHLRARIHPGQTVLIHAGAGGVGHIAVQLAKLHGCRVITTAGRPESIEFCRDVLRADEVIDYRSMNVVERVYEFMGIPTACEIEPERPGHILAGIARLVDAGVLHPRVSHVFPLERVADGHRQVETSRTVGKVGIAVRPRERG
jgi:NADPH:quinone reductase-like Zn-dependent oxidoreductase